jgi:hypothetical protein
MKKLSFMIVAAGLLATSALTSCKKDEVKPSTSTNTNKNNGSLSRVPDTKFWDNDVEKCVPGSKTCLDEVVIKSPKLQAFNTAISGGGGSVATLFGNQTVALELIPEFNDPSFANIKAMILSGNYNFDRVQTDGHLYYLMGLDGNVNHNSPVIIIDYTIEP